MNLDLMGIAYIFNTLRKLRIWRERNSVGVISAAGVRPIAYFHGNLNDSVYIELLCPHALPHLCKGTVETPIFM